MNMERMNRDWICELELKRFLTISWRLPLIHTNWKQGPGRSRWGRLFGGETSFREQKSGSSGPAFGPLVVVEGRTEWLDFLQEKLRRGILAAKNEAIRAVRNMGNQAASTDTCIM